MNFRLLQHKHRYTQVGLVSCHSYANPRWVNMDTARVFRCRCGAEQRVLTPAGSRLLACGDRLERLLGKEMR